MAIDKKLIHFKSKDNFMSANGVNGNIDSPSSGSEENGNAEYGQVKGTSIAFVKDSKEIWTHGNLYKSVNWSTLGEDDNTTDGYHAELQDKTVEITENGQVEVSADAGYYGLNKVSINTEIKSQSKSVDVTSNGVTEVTPDSGYSYLTGVSVNVNVPQEGGGGDNWEYLKFSSEYALANLNLTKLIGIQGGVSVTANGNTAYMGGLIAYDFIRQLDMVIEYGLTINYVTIKTDLSMMVSQVGTSLMYSLNDYLVSQGLSQSDIDSWERITEEEFYNTEA